MAAGEKNLKRVKNSKIFALRFSRRVFDRQEKKKMMGYNFFWEGMIEMYNIHPWFMFSGGREHVGEQIRPSGRRGGLLRLHLKVDIPVRSGSRIL